MRDVIWKAGQFTLEIEYVLWKEDMRRDEFTVMGFILKKGYKNTGRRGPVGDLQDYAGWRDLGRPVIYGVRRPAFSVATGLSSRRQKGRWSSV